MNRKTLFQNARSSAAVALGVAGVFGATFAVTTLVASAAEDQTPAPPAPVVQAPAPAATQGQPPAPRSESGPPRPPRPSFKEMDTNGDGTISQQEFENFRPAGPPPRFDDGPRVRGEGQDFGPGDGGRGPGPRGDRFGGRDGRGGPPPQDDRFGPPQGGRDDRYGPPQGPRGGRRGGQYGRMEQQGGPDCDEARDPRGGDPRGDRGPRPRGGSGGRDFGPPPGGPGDGNGPPDDRSRPPRRPND